MEPKCAKMPLLLMPVAAATFPIDRPSSPSTVASDAAARRIAARVRSPSARGCRGARLRWFIVPVVMLTR